MIRCHVVKRNINENERGRERKDKERGEGYGREREREKENKIWRKKEREGTWKSKKLFIKKIILIISRRILVSEALSYARNHAFIKP